MTALIAEAPVVPGITVTHPTRTFPHASEKLQQHLKAIGAHGTEVRAWSYVNRRPEVWHVTLDHPAFEPVTLSLEEFNLLTAHLQRNVRGAASSEIVFVIAQAIEAAQDITLVFDPETGRYRTPRAARKKVGEA